MGSDKLPIIFQKGTKSKSYFYSCSLFQLDKTEPDFLHYHDVLELGICLSGEGRYVTADFEQPFKAGDVQVIPPYHPHYNVTNGNNSLWEFIDIDIPRINSPHIFTDPAYFTKLVRSLHVSGIFTAEQAPSTVALIKGIAALTQSDSQEENADLTVSRLTTLLLELSSEAGNTQALEAAKRTELIFPAIRLAAKAMENCKKISPSDMATACFMSESYFRKNFSAIMGESPKSYLIRLQTRKAATLLATTSLRVSDIARLSCFDDNSTFYRCFMRAYSVSPAAYRRNFASPPPTHKET